MFSPGDVPFFAYVCMYHPRTFLPSLWVSVLFPHSKMDSTVSANIRTLICLGGAIDIGSRRLEILNVLTDSRFHTLLSYSTYIYVATIFYKKMEEILKKQGRSLTIKFCFWRHRPENNMIVTSLPLLGQSESGSDFSKLLIQSTSWKNFVIEFIFFCHYH